MARSFQLARLQAVRWYRVKLRALAPQKRWMSDAGAKNSCRGWLGVSQNGVVMLMFGWTFLKDGKLSW